jgi:hypothetical protein
VEAWRVEATHSGLEALARLARQRQDDLIAVTGGLTLAWSQTHVRCDPTPDACAESVGYYNPVMQCMKSPWG